MVPHQRGELTSNAQQEDTSFQISINFFLRHCIITRSVDWDQEDSEVARMIESCLPMKKEPRSVRHIPIPLHPRSGQPQDNSLTNSGMFEVVFINDLQAQQCLLWMGGSALSCPLVSAADKNFLATSDNRCDLAPIWQFCAN